MRHRLVVGLAIGFAFVCAAGCGSTRPAVEDIGGNDGGVTSATFSHPIDDGNGGSIAAAVTANDLPDSGACSCTEHTGGATWTWPCNYTMCFPWEAYECVANNQIATHTDCDSSAAPDASDRR